MRTLDDEMLAALREALAATDLPPDRRARLLRAMFLELDSIEVSSAIAVSGGALPLAREAAARGLPGADRLLVSCLDLHSFAALGPDLAPDRRAIAEEYLDGSTSRSRRRTSTRRSRCPAAASSATCSRRCSCSPACSTCWPARWTRGSSGGFTTLRGHAAAAVGDLETAAVACDELLPWPAAGPGSTPAPSTRARSTTPSPSSTTPSAADAARHRAEAAALRTELTVRLATLPRTDVGSG